MPLTHIEHYLVLTDDLDGTRNFYCKGLGMRVGARPPMAFLGYWLYVGDIPCIHVAEWESYRAYSTGAGIGISARAPGTGPVDHIAFNGIDFEAISGFAGIAAGEAAAGEFEAGSATNGTGAGPCSRAVASADDFSDGFSAVFAGAAAAGDTAGTGTGFCGADWGSVVAAAVALSDVL